MSALPAGLRAAIESLLDGLSRNALAERSQTISEVYRAGGGSAQAIREAADVAAYLAVRMPATYAAVAAALHETAQILPDFAPQNLIDIGTGPGTASFAALAQWPDIAKARLVDAHPKLLDAARRLAAGLSLPAAPEFVEAKAREALAVTAPADLVLVAYALVEMAEAELAALIAELWQHCTGLLVLVEPGTNDGFRRILRAREILLGEGGHVVAPCPHDLPCPLTAPDWCHFSVRLPRSRDHRHVKGASLPFEDEKYSYLVVARTPPVERPGARVLRPAELSKRGWQARLCADGGAFDTRVSRQSPQFARLRRLDWGDALEPVIGGQVCAIKRTVG